MRRSLFMVAALLVGALAAPVSATGGLDSPYGNEDNAVGTLRWLPRNANEKPALATQFRLVVVYDSSVNAAGQPIALRAKGPFGMKMFTTSQADVKMKAHSPRVNDLNTLTGQSLPPAVNETVAGVYGDVRDGQCSKLGTPQYSQAYSTTRSFLHPGSTPYVPITSGATCEAVNSSTAVMDAEGNVIGFQTTVTNHVPGFWIDVEWPARTIPQGLGTGRLLAEVWYGAAYDTAGDPGPFPSGVDATGSSKSVGSPGDYNQTFSFTATPGGAGPSCTEWDGAPDQPGTWADVKVQVPPSATKVTFKLFPKGDWDVIVLDPDGRKAVAGNWAAMDETEVVPMAGSQNIPDLVPGEFTFRACNFSGESTVMGAVIIE